MRTLVAEDDELSREVLAALLREEGHAVDTVESGEAALVYLQAERPAPEVILADWQMPGLSGDELARRMREACGAATMLLAMSGSALEEGEGAAFDGFLRKPFSMEELREALAGGRPEGTRELEDARAAALDEAVYAKLAASMGRSKLEELYGMCVNDAERRMARMRQDASDGEDAAYRREAHAIQGGCGMIGAREMQMLAGSMERRGLRDDSLASLEELMIACGRLRRILVAHAGEKEHPTEVSGEGAR